MSDELKQKCVVCAAEYDEEECSSFMGGCSPKCGSELWGTPCGYHPMAGHEWDRCPCNPKYEDSDYCQHCFGKLVPFKKYPDWEGRKYHKTCWKEMQRYERWG